MEYIQTILFQIPASRLEEASAADGLLSELDQHREFLRNQVGFQDLRITRSINNEGNILVVVETRWTDDACLCADETRTSRTRPSSRKHRGIVVHGQPQVLDMEALRTESSWKRVKEAEHARERVVLPIAIGGAGLAPLMIYGLSRIYLQIRGDNATALAAGIAIFVLLVSFYLANNPKASGAQIGGILGIAAIALVAGMIWAVASKDNGTGSGGNAAPRSAAPGHRYQGREPGDRSGRHRDQVQPAGQPGHPGEGGAGGHFPAQEQRGGYTQHRRRRNERSEPDRRLLLLTRRRQVHGPLDAEQARIAGRDRDADVHDHDAGNVSFPLRLPPDADVWDVRRLVA